MAPARVLRVGARGQVLHHARRAPGPARRRREIGSRIRVIDAGQVDPEVAQPIGVRAGEPPDECDGDRDAHRRGHEVLHREPGHLHEMAHRRLAAVALPVRVGHETDRGIPCRALLGHWPCRCPAATMPAPAAGDRAAARRRPRRPARCAGRSASAAHCRRPRPRAVRPTSPSASASRSRRCVPCSRPVACAPATSAATSTRELQPPIRRRRSSEPLREEQGRQQVQDQGDGHDESRPRPRRCSQLFHPSRRERQEPEDHQRQNHEDHVGHAAHFRSGTGNDRCRPHRRRR